MVQRLTELLEQKLTAIAIISYNTAGISLKLRDKGIVHPTSNSGYRCLYGSGPAKVASTVAESDPSYTLEQAKKDIKTYFARFPQLKRWLDQMQQEIAANGYVYSFFGRKRRLPNVFSSDKGIASHEVRSGINSLIQSVASDINVLAAIETNQEIKDKKLDAKIFMLVHDSTVALVRDDHVEEYTRIHKANLQKDRGCSIPGCPIGVDLEIGQDYSFGKFESKYRLESGILSAV